MAKGRPDSLRFYQLLEELRETHDRLVASHSAAPELPPLGCDTSRQQEELPGFLGAARVSKETKKAGSSQEEEKAILETFSKAKDSKHPLLGDKSTRMRRLVTHPRADQLVGSLIFLNTLVLSMELQAMLKGVDKDSLEFKAFSYANIILGVLFTFELATRVVAFGIANMFKEDFWAHLLDVVCVVGSWFEIAMIFILMNSTFDVAGTVVSGMMQTVRFIRVFRSARLLRLLQPLRMLVLQIVAALQSVFWALFLLGAIIYIFSLLIGIIIASSGATNLGNYWGSMPRIMTTLFQAVTGGIDWQFPVDELAKVHPVLHYIFLVYIAFVLFAVLNVVTGVFCQKAQESASEDLEHLVIEHFRHKRKYMEKTREFFALLDEDGSNELSLQELEGKEMDPQVSGYLAFMGLEVDSWADLFSLLDSGGDGTIDTEEFVHGIVRLRGSAKAMDVARNHLEIRQLKHSLVTWGERLELSLAAMRVVLLQSRGDTRTDGGGLEAKRGEGNTLDDIQVSSVGASTNRDVVLLKKAKVNTGDGKRLGTEAPGPGPSPESSAAFGQSAASLGESSLPLGHSRSSVGQAKRAPRPKPKRPVKEAE